MLHEPKSTLDATNRVVGILDAKYEKADLGSVVDEHCKHQLLHDWNKLLDLLTEYTDLFDDYTIALLFSHEVNTHIWDYLWLYHVPLIFFKQKFQS
jgi:hypothetical protein